MCGIGGIARHRGIAVERSSLLAMARALAHRGPDGMGVTTSAKVGLAHTRLSIIDVEGGAQPMTNEEGTVTVSFNGEIFNYVELREQLIACGHRFRTRSDTEVLVHGYEQWGTGLPPRLIGQFAFAIHDGRDDSVLLARDRFGVRPLFFTQQHGDLLFASEIKALFATGEVHAAPDLRGLDEVFTFWGARPPRTPFVGIEQLEPGTLLVWRDGRVQRARFYTLDFPERGSEGENAIEELDALLRDSVALRMRADVPVGGYLSGGLDSSIICRLATEGTPHTLRTFSIAFADERLDESDFQNIVAEQLGSVHSVERIGSHDIARVFPDVVRAAETPLVRTAPAPMFLLARATREQGIKVVLTGEGADELFLGYDLFKESAVRLFCARRPESAVRPRLFDRLYPYLGHDGRAGEFWRKFFLSAGSPSDPLFSHLPRFQLTSRIKSFYSAETRAELHEFDPLEELRASLPPSFARWSSPNRAAYLEMVTLLSSYLLCAQGDRMAMAHGVEGRFPFLDHRLFELAAALPTSSKLLGLKEKEILRRWARGVLPASISQRPKQPYRAPDAPAFFSEGRGTCDYVEDLLSAEAIRRVGIFDESAVSGLTRRCRTAKVAGYAENQALVAILSTQLWYSQFVMTTATDSLAFPFPHRTSHELQ